MEGGVRGRCAVRARRDLGSFDQPPGCGDDVVGAARAYAAARFVAQERSRTARPEEEADPEADREADGDVLDAEPDPTRQPTGWMRLKSTKRTTVKPAWPAANEIAARRVGGEQDRDRQHAPEHRLVRADADHEQRSDDDSDRGPGERADDRPAGAERVRPQDGERAEHDPERRAADPSAGRCRRRSRARRRRGCCSGTTPSGRSRARSPVCSVASRAAVRRRLDDSRRSSSGAPAPVAAARSRDLARRVGRGPDPERRVRGPADRARVGGVSSADSGSRRERTRDRRSSGVEPRRSRAASRPVEESWHLRASGAPRPPPSLPRPPRRRARAPAGSAEESAKERSQSSSSGSEASAAVAAGGARRAVLRPEESPAQRVDRRCARERGTFGRPARGRRPGGRPRPAARRRPRAAGRRACEAARGASAREDPGAGRQAPALEAVGIAEFGAGIVTGRTIGEERCRSPAAAT